MSNLLIKGKISKDEFTKLMPVGSKPGILYGLSKIHKELVDGVPKIRPINLSALATSGYNLAKSTLKWMFSVDEQCSQRVTTYGFVVIMFFIFQDPLAFIYLDGGHSSILCK